MLFLITIRLNGERRVKTIHASKVIVWMLNIAGGKEFMQVWIIGFPAHF